jgi:predicted Zn-dependent protease
LIAFLALAVLAIAAAAYWFTRPAPAGREEALDAFRNSPFSTAEPMLVAALERHPDDAELLDSLAQGYLKTDRPADAERVLSKLIQVQPGNAKHHRARYDVYQKLKRREEAYADAQRVLELAPNDPSLRRATMIDAMEMGRFPEAEMHCRTLMREKPNDVFFRSRLAEIRRARGDASEAAKILDELISEDPANYPALLSRGILFDENGEPALAIPLLRKVYEGDPRRKRTSGYQLAVALAKVGQHEEAKQIHAVVRRLQELELANDAVKNQPGDLDLRVRLAESMFRDGYNADGVAMLESVLKESPNHRATHLALAAYYEKQGQADLATKHRRLGGQP